MRIFTYDRGLDIRNIMRSRFFLELSFSNTRKVKKTVSKDTHI